jgi:predicted MFS family arabinose efflux permease
MRTLMLAIVPTGISFGALEVTMPAFAVEQGHAAGLAGIFLSAMAIGSLLGGLWYGARHWTGPIVARFIGLQVLFTVGLLPLLAAQSVGAMTVLMGLAGLALAPSAAAGYLVVDHVAPPGTVTEATTWVMTANVAGGALGAAIGGIVVQDVSVHAAIAIACAGPLLGTLVTLTRRRTLEAEHAPSRVSA